MLRPLFTIVCLAAASGAAAEPMVMHKESIKETFTGALLELDTPTDTKIPIRFSEDGLVSGEAGDLAGYLGSARDRGRWWVAGDRLCVKWFRWFDAEARCLGLRRDGNRIFWRAQDGNTGTATLAERARPAPEPAPRLRPPAAEQVARAETTPEPTPRETGAQETAPKQQVAQPETAESPTPGSVETPTATMLSMQFAGTTAFAAQPRIAAPVRAAEPMPAPARPSVPADEPANETPEKAAPVPRAAEPSPPEPAPRLARRVEPSAATRAAPPTAAPKMATPSFRVVRVEEDDVLNVRSGPSEYYTPVGRIPPEGRGVRIVGQCVAFWCPIRHGRVSGWVNRYYLAEEDMRSAGGPGTAPVAAR